ncbi:MAG: hypothetical protein ACFHXK_17855 [bacterium]
MKNLLFIAVLAAIVFWYVDQDQSVAVAIGDQLVYPGYQIEHLEPFALEARVLSRKDYTSGREADLSKTDLALGWGEMSRPEIIAQFDISQRSRAYFWRTDKLPLPRRNIETQSANMHMIAATPEVAAALARADEGDMVRFSGQLVEVRAEQGNWRWRSSLTRNDTGHGACEVIWVESFSLI